MGSHSLIILIFKPLFITKSNAGQVSLFFGPPDSYLLATSSISRVFEYSIMKVETPRD